MADPHIANVSYLLHFDGLKGQKFAVDSAKGRYFFGGGGFSLDSLQKKFGATSGKFDTTTNSIVSSGEATSDFVFGSGDFTLEGWMYQTALATATGAPRFIHFGQNWTTGDSVTFINSHSNISGRAGFWAYRLNASTHIVATPTVLPLNEWVHFAVTRKSGVFRLFVNGGLVDTNSSYIGQSIDTSTTNTAYVGNVPNIVGGAEGFTGFIDDVRVTKGVCRYDAPFTPSVEPFEPLWEGLSPAIREIDLIYRATGDQIPQRPYSAVSVGNAYIWEVQTSGNGRIAGKVTIENIPGSRKVRLYRKTDGLLIRETWSASNGDYSFEGIDPNWEYFVVSHDHLRVHNAVVSDMIDPP